LPRDGRWRSGSLVQRQHSGREGVAPRMSLQGAAARP
jgi:hypothetical protein